jgi:hypothetical protein
MLPKFQINVHVVNHTSTKEAMTIELWRHSHYVYLARNECHYYDLRWLIFSSTRHYYPVICGFSLQ